MATDLTIYNEAEAMVADLVAKDKAQQHDHTTPEGEKALRSWVHRIKGGCGDIEKARKDGKSGLLKMGKLIDAKAKELEAPLRAIQAERMKPLNEIAAKAQAEKDAFLAKQEEERQAKADADAKELEALRAEKAKAEQAEREKEIAERAKEEAERKAAEDVERAKAVTEAAAKKAEQDKIYAFELAERQKADAIAKVEAEAKAKEDARLEQENIAKCKKQAAEKAEQQRTADVNHRKTIETDVFFCLNEVIGDNERADALVEAIKAGKIKHVTITY